MTQQTLFSSTPEPQVKPPRFDGPDVSESDVERLASQLERVKAVMSSGEWYTLDFLAVRCRGSESGISARIRDLRKTRFGGYTVERRRANDSGLWEYRLLVSKSEAM